MRSHDEITLGGKAMLLSIVSQLDSLSHYQPVGALLEDVRMALHQGAGMTPHALARGVGWAHSWGALDKRLKALYEDMSKGTSGAANKRAAEVAIWKVLEGTNTATGMTYAILRDAFTSKYGYPPPIEMIPLPHKSRSRNGED